MPRLTLPSAALAPALGAAALCAGAGLAEAAITGAWCAGEEVMWIRDDGIGFNAHTLCNAALPVALDQTGAYDTALSCENVYVAGEAADGTLMTEQIPMPDLAHLHLTERAGGLMADFGAGAQVAYSRCPWDAEGAGQ
jgi:hypothetical protein